MPIRVRCPRCGHEADVSRQAIGLSAKCNGCQQVFPVPRGSGDLTVEWGSGVAGRRIPLVPPNPVTIGRAEDNTLALPGEQVSRHHARIVWRDEGWLIEDMGSGNGTWVNARPARPVHLENGDGITIGEYAMRVTLAGRGGGTDSPLEALASREPTPTVPPTAPRPTRSPHVPGGPARTADPRERTVVGAAPRVAPNPPSAAPPPAPRPGPVQTPARVTPVASGAQLAFLRWLIAIAAVILAGILGFLLWGRR